MQTKLKMFLRTGQRGKEYEVSGNVIKIGKNGMGKNSSLPQITTKPNQAKPYHIKITWNNHHGTAFLYTPNYVKKSSFTI